MKKRIYVLTHNRPRRELKMLSTGKLLGYFLSISDAVDAIKNVYIDKPGFKDHPEDFFIEEFIVGDTDWKAGFNGPVNIEENPIYKGGRPNLIASVHTSKPGEPHYIYTFFTKSPKQSQTAS